MRMPILTRAIKGVQQVAHRTPEFFGAGDPKPTTLSGLPADQLPVTAVIKGLTNKLKLHPDWPTFATGYALAPKILGRAVDRPTDLKRLANETLFQGSGFDRSSNPSYFDVDSLAMKSATPATAASFLIAAWVDHAGTDLSAAKKKALTSDVKALIASQAKGAEHIYTLHWTNQDDTDLFGVMTASPKTGQVRLTGWYPEG